MTALHLLDHLAALGIARPRPAPAGADRALAVGTGRRAEQPPLGDRCHLPAGPGVPVDRCAGRVFRLPGQGRAPLEVGVGR